MPVERHVPQPYLNQVICGDCIAEMDKMPESLARLVIADPPYFKVLTDEPWDKQWGSYGDYINWSLRWIWSAMRLLMPGGLLYCFGQPGKREHVMLHLMSEATRFHNFHDLIIWDRVVGYNQRSDSFTPAYEMILVLRKAGGEPYFNRDAIREPYPNDKIAEYAKDKRYKDRDRRLAHLQKGKYLTNLWSVPSLKGSSKEKAGHPAQKPTAVIERIVGCSSAPGDWIVDPFLGSGTTAVVAEQWGRKWTGIEVSQEYVTAAQERIQSKRPSLNHSEEHAPKLHLA